jgi:hypothetical protein
MIHASRSGPGCPVLALQVAALAIPDDSFANTIDGNWP